MSPLESSYSITAGPEYSKVAEAEDKDLKTKYMKVVEVLDKEMNKSLEEI